MNQETSFEEEEEHWTAIARSLDEEQLKELDKRIQDLRNITMNMRAFQRKTESTYYTRREQSEYVEKSQRRIWTLASKERSKRRKTCSPPNRRQRLSPSRIAYSITQIAEGKN